MKTNISEVFSLLQCVAFPVCALIIILLPYTASEVVSSTSTLAILGVFILALGLPHGALDAWIAQRIGLSTNPRNYFLFVIVYLASAVLVVTIWSIFPTTSLLVFLLVSAIHFADDWWEGEKSIAHLPSGFLLLLMPIGFHTHDVAEIFAHLSGAQGAELAHYLALPPWLILCAMLALIARAIFQKKPRIAFELFTLLALAHQANPLVYFSLYFCLLHSPRHFSNLFGKVEKKEHPRLLGIVFLYTTAALLLALPLWWMSSSLPLDSIIINLIFIGLAALTYPHMFMIYLAKSWLKSTRHTLEMK